jgi:transposase-like protein
MRRRRTRPTPLPQSAFAGFRFPSDVIVLAVRWYLRFGLSYRDVEELLAERGIEVDHVTIYRWVQRFTPLLADAARPCRHAVGDRWQVDETYVKVAGRWRYIYRAIDQFGQVVDVFVSRQRDAAAAHQFFQRAIGATKVSPVEVTTDQAPVYPAVLEERLPAAWHRTDRYANNRIECDHGRLKARLRPMRGLKQDRSARVVIAGMRWCRTFSVDTTSGAVALSDHPVRLPPLSHLTEQIAGTIACSKSFLGAPRGESLHCAGLSRRRRAQCNSARDAASVAPPHGAPTLDLSSPATGPAADSRLDPDLDRTASHREPALGLPADSRGTPTPSAGSGRSAPRAWTGC